jgi:putative chitinase
VLEVSAYLMCSIALFNDDRLLREPQLLEQPQWAAQSAGRFWFAKGLNVMADGDDFVGITKIINGGTSGLAKRRELWGWARAVLGLRAA